MAYKQISPQSVAEGGTGASTLTGVVTGNGTSAMTANAVTQYGVLVGGASNAVSSTAVGTSGDVLTSNGAGMAPTYQTPTGGGFVIQQVRNSTASVVDCTTIMPYDNTIPQITEGDEALTVTITPTNSSSILVMQFNSWGYSDATSWSAALFQDSTADAIASKNFGASGTLENNCIFTYYMTAGTTSATTFRIRIGPSASSRHYYLNGASGGGSLYNGTAITTFIITEYSS